MRPMSPLLGFALIAALPGIPAHAADPPPERYRSQVVYGNDPCPKAEGDEIVVCARQPESERYRVPKRFRNPKRTDAAVQAWGNRAATADEAGRIAGGLPNTCSPVGSGGQTGCQRQFLRQAREQREADRAEAAEIPGD